MATFDQRVEDAHVIKYSSAVTVARQQLGSKFRPYVSEMPAQGVAVRADLEVQGVEYEEMQPRPRSNPDNKAEMAARYLVIRKSIGSGQYLDNVDKWRAAFDPTSQLTRTHVGAAERGIDDRIIGRDKAGNIVKGGILGAATTGDGEGPGALVDLPSSQYVPVDGSGITVEKAADAIERFMKADLDMDREQLVWAISPAEWRSLIGIVEAAGTSINLLQQAEVRTGKLAPLMGVQWLVTNRLPVVAGKRYCPIWIKSAVMLGVWEEMQVKLFNDTSALMTPYMHVQHTMDCVRTKDEGVIVVETDAS